MSSSEIAKLESRWRENPQGLTFAPLAEAYRKMRDIPRALEILTEGLGRHPDYIPASIVLGRCQLDLGDDAQAESAFSRVLELDDENVIALKALAEIAERQGRLDEAGARLLSLLAIDRSNDEARIQLARVEELRESGGAPRTPESEREAVVAPSATITAAERADAAGDERTAEPAPTLLDHFTPESDEFERETEAPAEAPPLLADLEDNLQPVGEVEQLPDLVPDDTPSISSEGAGAFAMPGLVGQDFQEHSAGVTPLEDLAPGTASIDPVAEFEGAEDILLDPAPSNEFQIASASDDWDTSAAAAGGAEYQLPSAADELASLSAADEARDSIDPISAEFERTPDDVFGDTPDLSRMGEEDSAFAGETPDESVGLDAEAVSADSGVAEELEDVAADFEEAVSFEPPVEFAPAALADEPPDEDDAGAPSPASTGSTQIDGDESDEDALDADLVVTESMAELFLRQGHRAEALRVYRELYRRNRDDLGLREKVDELETALAAEETAVSPRAGYQAPEASRSVAAFLTSILDSRPADPPAGWAEAAAPKPLSAETAPAAPPGEAAPTRPATDHLSLSAVFGEEGSPVPPASPGAAVPGDDGISFDAFFGGEQTGGAPRARTASREDDDLDQFHAWLQNLKR
ncbi:MAG TPA: tetratricopeptide repeat protein [Gemmatimonadales bacterium]|nr:tetratricopeptide repeat protein [Gemmatimonadales bacterium]